MRWFRFYEEVLDDPKVQSLTPELFKFWVNILCISSKCNGKLPLHETLSFHLREPVETLQKKIKTLIDVGLLDEKKGILSPHNWSGRQYQSDSSTDRVRKHRNKKRTLNETLHETFHDRYTDRFSNAPETDTDTDTEKDITTSNVNNNFEVETRDVVTTQTVVDGSFAKSERPRGRGEWILLLSAAVRNFDKDMIQRREDVMKMLANWEVAAVIAADISAAIEHTRNENKVVNSSTYYAQKVLNYAKARQETGSYERRKQGEGDSISATLQRSCKQIKPTVSASRTSAG